MPNYPDQPTLLRIPDAFHGAEVVGPDAVMQVSWEECTGYRQEQLARILRYQYLRVGIVIEALSASRGLIALIPP